MKPGDIGLVKSPGNMLTLSGEIRFWGDSEFTHSLQGCDYIIRPDGTKEATVFEANLTSMLTPWSHYQKGKNGYRIYTWNDPRVQEIFAEVSHSTFEQLNGDYYGILQLPWFVWRRIGEVTGLFTAHRNWITLGKICTEDVMRSLFAGAARCKHANLGNYAWDIVLAFPYNENSVRPLDIFDIMESLAAAKLCHVDETKEIGVPVSFQPAA